jgi:hypothetical protein
MSTDMEKIVSSPLSQAPSLSGQSYNADMSPRVVLVAGAGSLRATPPTLAALAAYAPDYEVQVRLWEPDPERLDLFDRFVRTCLEITKLGHQVSSFSDPLEAYDQADTVIYTLNENGARRFLAPPPEEHEGEAHHEEEVRHPEDVPGSLMEFGYGDRNRPTPRTRLSPSIRAMIHRPDLSLDRSSALRMALERLDLLLPQKAMALYLVRGMHLLPERGSVMEWPLPLTDGEIKSRPHEILRHIQGDTDLDDYIEECRHSPVMRWLKSI